MSISLVTGNNGILGKAKTSVDTTKKSSAKEQVELKIAEFQQEFYEAVYVNNEADVNTKKGDWIAQNKTGEQKTEDYKFTITGDNAPYKVTIIQDSTLETAIEGKLTEDGILSWASSGGGATYTPYSVGDEVTIGEESFYVIEASDENTEMVTLLAKYVLDANATKQTNANIDCIFSTNNYWSGETLPTSSPYFNLNDYSAVKNDIGSAVYKANKYATEELGAESGRLLTYKEANDLKDSFSDIIWVTYGNSKCYWLGSAVSASHVWGVDGRDRSFGGEYYIDGSNCGVRPVIKISKSKISKAT